MKYAYPAGLALLLAAIALPAQNPTKPAPTEPTGAEPTRAERENFVLVLPGSTCPVGMHALQGSSGSMIAVRDGKPPEGPAQRIHLILTSATAARVVAAKVLVHGQSGSASILQTADRAQGHSSQSRTPHLAFELESADSVAADLLLPGFTTVRSIELQALTYTDGSTWAVAGEQACHVAPDPMMLVGSR